MQNNELIARFKKDLLKDSSKFFDVIKDYQEYNFSIEENNQILSIIEKNPPYKKYFAENNTNQPKLCSNCNFNHNYYFCPFCGGSPQVYYFLTKKLMKYKYHNNRYSEQIPFYDSKKDWKKY